MVKTIAGYTDRMSAAPGDEIAFKVSVEDGAATYHAEIVRLISTDSHRDGPGMIERPVDAPVNGDHPARRQVVHCGSYVSVPGLPDLASFTMQAFVWPTLLDGRRQTVMGQWDDAAATGAVLEIDERGGAALRLGVGGGAPLERAGGAALLEREWALVAASYDAETGALRLYQEPRKTYPGIDNTVHADLAGAPTAGHRFNFAPFTIAASGRERTAMSGHFNGKIDRPRLAARALDRGEIEALCGGPAVPAALAPSVSGAWDFARETPGDRIVDVSGNGHDGRAVNMPTRAMTGHNWTGDIHDWRHAPEQYGAIHFHDDDIYDAGWQTDFTLTLPDDMASGVYAARLSSGGEPEHVVFFVRPRRGTPTAKIAYLASTATYMAYGNYMVMECGAVYEAYQGALLLATPEDLFLAAHPEYGGSLYAKHNDGSGVCYSSCLRPLVSMRPGTPLWQFNGDGYLTYWLDKLGHDVDVITDEDLHRDGLDLIAPYQVVMTGNHPEYWSTAMWDAVDGYIGGGGRFMYLGGNGFYWRIAYSDELPGVIEVRRADGGPWESAPGEYRLSLNGEQSSMWRRGDRTPNQLVGVGTAAQGFDRGTYYLRKPGSFDPRAAFIFEGVGENELIGDFGFAGGGASGQEIDRYDRALGSPPHALVLATSEGHNDNMLLIRDDFSTTHLMLGGTENDMVRSDMVFFEAAGGGAVFSTGSISWIASLAWNDCANNVSRITDNVLKRFLDPRPFEL